jgi:hypothetical protein
MIRVRLPFLGVAALLAAPAAFAQAPLPVVFPAGLHVIVVPPEFMPDEPAALPALSLVSAPDSLLLSADPDKPDKPAKPADASSSRIAPTPQQTIEPPCTSCAADFEEFPSFCCLPFAAPPPPPPPSGHKCRFWHKSCNNGYGQGYGNPYAGGQGGYGGYCGWPPPQPSSCRRCQHKHHAAPYGPPYPGYGYGSPCMSCGPMPWAPTGYNGFNNDGCCGFGYCPPPYAQPQQKHCHGLFGKHRCAKNAPCPRCGYPSYTPPSPAWEYPVAGWSTPNDGLNAFIDPNCLPCNKHCHGLFHRFRSCKHHQQPPPPPCYNPYWQAQWQPCCMDGGWGDIIE